jgi:cyclopropane fatty-acyl-phospholipid synthase-like methyltransferase
MSQAESWQVTGNAPEIYEQHLFPAVFQPWATLLIEQGQLQPGERILDVACGTGFLIDRLRFLNPHFLKTR